MAKPLTRAQLAKFLPDQESIRRFEQIDAAVETIAAGEVSELLLLIASADSKSISALGIALQAMHDSALANEAKANQALGMIDALRNESSAPQPVHDRTIEKSTRVLQWLSM